MGVGDWDAKPADVEAELAKEQYPDCLPCRAVGAYLQVIRKKIYSVNNY
jgi:hypothetical protein